MRNHNADAGGKLESELEIQSVRTDIDPIQLSLAAKFSRLGDALAQPVTGRVVGVQSKHLTSRTARRCADGHSADGKR